MKLPFMLDRLACKTLETQHMTICRMLLEDSVQFSSRIDTPQIKIRSRLGAGMGACTLPIYMLGAETLPKDKCTYVFNKRVITIGCWVGNPHG